MAREDLLNKGLIIRPGKGPPFGPEEGRTFLVSGIGRGGTTLVAALLREAGVFLGEQISDLVHEDYEILDVLRSHDSALLDAFIARRNARGGDWGFKTPVLIAYLQAKDLLRFRNPHLLMVFRDPVAIAVRHGVAEHEDPIPVVGEVAKAMAGMAALVEQCVCPAMLLSYEKAIMFPEALVDAVIRFCGFDPGNGLRQRLLARVQPNAETYIATARRDFKGMLDIVWNGMLHGWCWEVGADVPIDVDISLDGAKVATARADQFRSDLQQAGIGSGYHGFSVDLVALGALPDTRVQARVSGRTYELNNSGKALRLFPGFTPTALTRRQA